MRKGITILFILVMMLSGAHLTVAKHFCGGKVAATKISLSGKLATCGMEGTGGTCPSSGSNLNTHCCNNQVATFGMINIFTAPVSVQSEKSEIIPHIFYLPVARSFYHNQVNNRSFTDAGPPGEFTASAVNLINICISRT
jgi:hypothetical protein